MKTGFQKEERNVNTLEKKSHFTWEKGEIMNKTEVKEVGKVNTQTLTDQIREGEKHIMRKSTQIMKRNTNDGEDLDKTEARERNENVTKPRGTDDIVPTKPSLENMELSQGDIGRHF